MVRSGRQTLAKGHNFYSALGTVQKTKFQLNHGDKI